MIENNFTVGLGYRQNGSLSVGIHRHFFFFERKFGSTSQGVSQDT